jgi:thiamine-phosphate pyrophosphorylase
LRIGRLHILTDRSIQDRFDHAELAGMAIRGGADLIQFREKTGTTREMIAAARAARDVCRRMRIPFLVNDRVDVAIAVDADGVHLGLDDLPLPLARRLLGPHRVIGASAGSVEEAIAGWRQGADYLGCGPVFATKTKLDAGPASGTTLLSRVARAVAIPVIGIAGIGPSNLEEVLRTGAHGAAVISSVCAAPDPEEATRALRAIIDAYLQRAAGEGR